MAVYFFSRIFYILIVKSNLIGINWSSRRECYTNMYIIYIRIVCSQRRLLQCNFLDRTRASIPWGFTRVYFNFYFLMSANFASRWKSTGQCRSRYTTLPRRKIIRNRDKYVKSKVYQNQNPFVSRVRHKVFKTRVFRGVTRCCRIPYKTRSLQCIFTREKFDNRGP